MRGAICPSPPSSLFESAPSSLLIGESQPLTYTQTQVYTSFRGVSFSSMHPSYISNDSDKRICRTSYFVPGGMTWHGLLLPPALEVYTSSGVPTLSLYRILIVISF